MAMMSEVEGAPAAQAPGSSRFGWLFFPSGLVSQNRQIERSLAALIWVAMPFVFYLLRTHPGGFGELLTEHPVYFAVAVVYVIVAVLTIYLVCLGLTRLASTGNGDAARSKRRLALRGWMSATVSCFAVTAIVLAASIWISRAWLQDSDNPVTIDAVSRMLAYVDWKKHIVGYGYALVAALAIGFVVRLLARTQDAEDATSADALPQTRNRADFLSSLFAYLVRNPDIFLVALFAYLILAIPMALMEGQTPGWLNW